MRFPAGSYLFHSIHLKSHVTLYLDQGSNLVAADTSGQAGEVGYDPPEPNDWIKFQDFGHSHWHNSLIWGEGLSKGTGPGPRAEQSGVGNKSIALKNCRNVRVSNCSVNSPWDDAICPITNITMRDIVSAPVFLRLGSRMRGPHGVPVGALRRVIIGNIVCSNSASRISSIISGIPGHPIENVKIHGIYVQHRGGGTPEAAAVEPPELEDARPAFVLNDVQGADFSHIKIPHPAGVPAFVLNKVADFSAYDSRPLPNTQLDQVDRKTL